MRSIACTLFLSDGEDERGERGNSGGGGGGGFIEDGVEKLVGVENVSGVWNVVMWGFRGFVGE